MNRDKIIEIGEQHKFEIEDGYGYKNIVIRWLAFKNKIADEILASQWISVEDEACSICKGRKIMEGMYSMIDNIPNINDFYNDDIANVINALDDAVSVWRCMCNEETHESN